MLAIMKSLFGWETATSPRSAASSSVTGPHAESTAQDCFERRTDSAPSATLPAQWVDFHTSDNKVRTLPLSGLHKLPFLLALATDTDPAGRDGRGAALVDLSGSRLDQLYDCANFNLLPQDPEQLWALHRIAQRGQCAAVTQQTGQAILRPHGRALD